MLFQIPQRYRFSSKSQLVAAALLLLVCCFRYHKGTDFQANHNWVAILTTLILVVLDTTKVQIFKQITTAINSYVFYFLLFQIPQRYRFSSKSQQLDDLCEFENVVLDTTKVQIFKQITTNPSKTSCSGWLFQIPQRYRFSSKSQLVMELRTVAACCFRYHKGTDFQANHNVKLRGTPSRIVVLDTTKVQIFKQITTHNVDHTFEVWLFQIPQRYRFSSKSQLYNTLAILF